MRILVLLLNIRRGGMEKIAALLTAGLRSKGMTAELVAVHGPVEYGDLLRQLNLQATILVDGAPPYFWTSLPSHVSRLRRVSKKMAPDVTIAIGGQALILAKLAGISPIVYSAQNSDGLHWHGFRPGHVLLRWLERFALKSQTVWVVGCSESVSDIFLRRFSLDQHRVATVMNALDVASFRDISRDPDDAERVVLMVGTLYSQKNYPMALRAVKSLLDRGERIDLWIAGNGPDKGELEKACVELGIVDHVVFLGRRDDIPALMAQASCYWMTSRYEGLGIALAEAMTARVPIVATDVPGVRDIMTDGETGFLVQLEDQEALADKTIYLFEHLAFAQHMANAARAKALLACDPTLMVSRYLDFLRTVHARWKQIQIGRKLCE